MIVHESIVFTEGDNPTLIESRDFGSPDSFYFDACAFYSLWVHQQNVTVNDQTENK